MHEPLSRRLAQILESSAGTGGITLNAILQRTEGRGIYLVIILLGLPFIVPVSIPGVSTALGLMVAWLSLRLALGLVPRLPRSLGERRLPPNFEKNLGDRGVRFLRWIERWVRPRQTTWLASGWARAFNASLMAYLGLLLALPFPPLPPFTNSLPCYSLILIAVSTMEEDGVTIWFGYLLSAGTTIYLLFVAKGLQVSLWKLFHWLGQLQGA